ncbi:MAG TPA: ABC transporter permease [Anaeromyxobacter sp.]|nr:ABC transporter permease [Anaeromyxobacter sp.]
MSAFLKGLAEQLRRLTLRRSHQLMLLLFLGASTLSVATYRQGAMRELPVALYDADGTALSRALARAIDATPELRVLTDPPPTLHEAELALTRGELCAVVLIPDGFTAALKRGRRAEVVVAADLSNVLTGKTAQRSIARVLATAAAGAEVSVLERLGTPPASALARAVPITVTEALPGNPAASYASYVAPAFAYFFVHVLTLFLAWSVLWPPVPGRAIADAAGRFAACALLGLAAALVVTYGVLSLDHLAPASSPSVVVPALLALVLGDLLFASALAALFRGGLFGFQVTVLLGMLSLMLSGLTWPWDAIPGPLRALAAAIPFTPFGRAMRVFFAGRAELGDLAGPLAWMGAQAIGCGGVLALRGAVRKVVAIARHEEVPS